MSKTNPDDSNFLALPPGSSFFSKSVTSKPSAARHVAAASPEKPDPMTAILAIFLLRNFFKVNELVIKESKRISSLARLVTRVRILEYLDFRGILIAC
jgi:hypothetical protein